MAPGPTTAWMVREGDPAAFEGTLSIDERRVLFEPSIEGRSQVEIPTDRLLHARRARGTPLMTLTFMGEDGPERLFFYFAKPPPLPGERPAGPLPMFRPPKGIQKSAAALSLRASNKLLKREIEVWVNALREAGAGG